MTFEIRNFTILSGPSKMDLMLSLFEGKTIELEVQPEHNRPKHKLKGKFHLVELEDGSHESWNIKFYGGSSYTDTQTFVGYYSTRTRKGQIKF